MGFFHKSPSQIIKNIYNGVIKTVSTTIKGVDSLSGNTNSADVDDFNSLKIAVSSNTQAHNSLIGKLEEILVQLKITNIHLFKSTDERINLKDIK